MSVKSEVFVYIDKTNPIDVSSFSSNGLWDLLNTSAQNLGEDDDDSKTRISFKVLIISCGRSPSFTWGAFWG